jgi:hypothetical protein
MFIKLNTIGGIEAHFNVAHIVFFMWDAIKGGSVIKLTFLDMEIVQQTPQEIEQLIAEARK